LPIRYGRHLRDWSATAEPPDLSAEAGVAWAGQNPYTRNSTGVRRIYRVTWKNPRPTVEIESLDFVSALTRCAPFLIAITVE
jgi:hypothetical protein